MTDYAALNARLDALTEGVLHPIANLANASALLWQSLPEPVRRLRTSVARGLSAT